MSVLPNGFEFSGLWCFARGPGPNAYAFVPLRADLNRAADNRPMMSLIQTGKTGYLMLTAVWRASDASVATLRQELAARTGNPSPETIVLSPAPVKVARCNLLLGDGAGNFQTLATNTTSGMPPYSALFGVNLTADQFPRVAAAMNGRPDFLAVEYEASLPTEARASARLVPQSSRFVQLLRDAGGPDGRGVRSALEEAIQDGLAVVSVTVPDQPSSELIATLYERLITQAATVLPRLIATWEGDSTGDLEVAVELSETTSAPLRPRVDIATQVLDQASITVVAAPSTERAPLTPRPLRVSLAFDPAGAPLAWVRVRGGDSEIILNAPDFRRADLPGDWRTGPLMVTAGFTNGAHTPGVEIQPPMGSELRLLPEQVGLRELAIDAMPLADAGAQSAEISLRYRPPQVSGEQHQTLQLGNGTWATRWWVVSNTTSWLRYLEFSWKAIARDGRVTGASTSLASSPKIVLSM